MKKACVIGCFADGIDFLNGQTIKTRIVTEELQNRFGQEQVFKIDTYGGWKTLFKTPIQALRALRESTNVLIFPAADGVRVYVPLLSFLKGFFKNRKLHYVVIGGWLPCFLQKRKWLLKALKNFDGIYVETGTMKAALEAQGLCNVFVMPNCKRLDILSESELIYSDGIPYRLCTFSRVIKEKGIEEAVRAVCEINSKYSGVFAELDIYGQIDDNQRNWFERLQSTVPQYIRYKGIVPFNQSTEVLKGYDALLFPTYYDGEGFAGTIIDAFAAGLPVIASDWKYNPEIITSGTTGLIFKTRSTSELENAILFINSNTQKWNLMRQNCISEARRYLPENAMKELIDRIVNE